MTTKGANPFKGDPEAYMASSSFRFRMVVGGSHADT